MTVNEMTLWFFLHLYMHSINCKTTLNHIRVIFNFRNKSRGQYVCYVIQHSAPVKNLYEFRDSSLSLDQLGILSKWPPRFLFFSFVFHFFFLLFIPFFFCWAKRA